MEIRSRIRTLGLHEQAAWVRSLYPEIQCSVRGGLLVCVGPVQPLELSRTYRARIEYRIKKSPSVSIEDPPLTHRPGEERIPHTYAEDRPCLFLPRAGEWRSDRKLALTIIPWLSLWLFYYEIWLATGVWHGGGVHPPARDPQGASENGEG